MLATNEAHFDNDPFLRKVSAPALQPKCMWPKCYSEPLTFLKNIDHIDINDTKTVNGVVFYVLDVYVCHQLSRIPTNNNKQQHQSLEQPMSPPTKGHNTPDFRVLRRFSDFETLRGRVTTASQQQLMATCPYCDSIRVFMFACYRRPTVFVKLCTGPETRKQLLSHFINRLIEYAVGHPKSDVNTRPQDVWCLGFQSIPVLVEQFLQLRRYVE
ncbi:hypothetical protein PR003_g24769 [Phytophthora rubi]|uniref:PX domain-containing protein n=1 Tax=Phytophthora rubi TaxID=129364 RepID=A0A6A3IS24_9STRA|nr:hypothetical protein PR002_g23576 [Phytophthora rubi]KAE9004075.1 hypothetical protein PR001_g17813 [Phytophthora rubi]KAE9292400.1 hypothetical protein PR003_g24769 [Phytophthora rubi]